MAPMAVRVSDSFPRDALRFEPSEKWVRGELHGETVVDSRRTWLVWEPTHGVPGWCFPREDVREDLLRPVEVRPDEHEAEVSEVFDLDSAERAAWVYADPDLEGRLAVAFKALDRWL